MSKRPTRRHHRLEEDVHLNITPFIDILVCLILFLLTSAAISKLGVVDTTLPQLTDVRTLQEQKKDDKEQLVVTVHIEQRGFVVNRVGSDANAGKQKMWAEGGSLRRFFPRRPDRSYDFSGLNHHMQLIKNIYPDGLSVLLFPSSEIDYETIVGVMDASREIKTNDGKRTLLFPDVVIGHVAEENQGG